MNGPLVVYTIVERERDGRKFWVRIGTAFKNRDGSLNVALDALPANGTLHIREMRNHAVVDGAGEPMHDPAVTEREDADENGV